MAQGVSHSQLVHHILDWCHDEFSLKNAFIYVDEDNQIYEKPKKIGKSIPDVLIKIPSSGIAIIGEAKTHHDIRNDRFKKQMEDYFSFLLRNEKSHLVISTEMSTYDEVSRRVNKYRNSNNMILPSRVHIIGFL